MTITPRQMLVDPSKYNIKCPYEMDAEYITIHNTANDASANNEISYMIKNNNQVSFHFASDDVEIVQGLPINRNAWAAGDGGSGKGNRKSIHIEICYSKSGGEKYYKAEANTIKFVAQLLHERNWGIDRVKQHNAWSGKNCPHRIRAEGRWQQVLDDIQTELNKLKAPKPTPINVNADTYEVVKGDTLWSISQKFNITVDKLKSLNGLKSDLINIGQELKLNADSSYYTVVSGDSLWAIAKKYNMSVQELKNLNGLTSDVIHPNQKLKVKGGQESVAPQPKPTPPQPKPQPKPVTNGIKSIGRIKIVNVNSAAIVMDRPDRNNAKNIGTITKGKTIEITGSVKGKNSDSGYWEVIWNGRRAYITGKFGQRI